MVVERLEFDKFFEIQSSLRAGYDNLSSFLTRASLYKHDGS